MTKHQSKGLRRIINAAFYSWDGLKAAIAGEAAFRQELAIVVCLAPVAFFVSEVATERALMIASLFLILIAELANSAIEAAIDRISSQQHPLSKRAKDMGSALVFMAFVNAFAVWGIILAG